MNVFNPTGSVANMWKAFNNMPSNTTVLDRVTEKEKAEEQAYINRAISQATDREYINSKKTDGAVFRRLEQAKKEQSDQTQENIQAIRRFIGKGMKVDAYV